MRLYYGCSKEKIDNFLSMHQGMFKSAYSVKFTDISELDLITEYATKYGLTAIKQMYQKIGIEFDNVLDNRGTYTIGDNVLTPSRLSTSERNMLYVMLCKELNKKVAIVGLLESLDYQHRKIILDIFKSSNDNIDVLVLSDNEKQGTDGMWA